MKATYFKKERILRLDNHTRAWGDVPPVPDFNTYPPVKRFLRSQALRERFLDVTIND